MRLLAFSCDLTPLSLSLTYIIPQILSVVKFSRVSNFHRGYFRVLYLICGPPASTRPWTNPCLYIGDQPAHQVLSKLDKILSNFHSSPIHQTNQNLTDFCQIFTPSVISHLHDARGLLRNVSRLAHVRTWATGRSL